MEPKVISQVLDQSAHSRSWSYDKNRTFSQQSGSANNWAHGFVSFRDKWKENETDLFRYNTHGPKNIDKVDDVVRKEIEICELLLDLICWILTTFPGIWNTAILSVAPPAKATIFPPKY